MVNALRPSLTARARQAARQPEPVPEQSQRRSAPAPSLATAPTPATVAAASTGSRASSSSHGRPRRANTTNPIPTSQTAPSPASTLTGSYVFNSRGRTYRRTTGGHLPTTSQTSPYPAPLRASQRQQTPQIAQEGNTASNSSNTASSSPSQRRRIDMNASSRARSSITEASRPSTSLAPGIRRNVGALTVPARPNAASSSSRAASRVEAPPTTPLPRDTQAIRPPSLAAEPLRNQFLRSPLTGGSKSSSPSNLGQRAKAKSEKPASTLKLTITRSHIFHHSPEAQCNSNMFEKLPTEILCAILGYVVDPGEEKLGASDDGDGPRIDNSLQYWYLDPTRSLLRQVCRSWNETILAMAREIHVILPVDESIKSLLESIAVKNRTASLFRSPGLARRAPVSTSTLRNTTGNTTANIGNVTANTGNSHVVRRSARLMGASAANTATTPAAAPSSSATPLPGWVLPNPYPTSGNSRVSLAFGAYNGFAESHGIRADQHPRLFHHIIQDQYERRRIAKQKSMPIQCFFNPVQRRQDPSNPSAAATSSHSTVFKANPWTCPPFISSLSIQGSLARSMDPKEDIVMSAGYSGNNPHPGGGAVDFLSVDPQYHMVDSEQGSVLDHWLRAAVPKNLTTFSISRSADFGLNGLLSLPKHLKTLKITRCPKITGGVLFMGFQHLSNLTSLTVCSEVMFTDESFVAALSSLKHLHQLTYIYPCDPVQPAWRDLFRYCSSCELYHRRVTTKTYTRKLLIPELPHQIQDFSFEMDETKFQHLRVDSFDQNSHGFDRTDNTKHSLALWKAGSALGETTSISSQTSDWCGFDLSRSQPRSWWPDNLTRLNLSKTVVTNARFDVPPRLTELIIAYPLEPNEITDNGELPKLEEDKQWFPCSLMTLEVHGVPYHVSCDLQDNPSGKASGWMAYIDKMLKMVPHQLEHLTINSFQVPDAVAMTTMRDRVQKSLKTWKVRLLCPQRPRENGFSSLQLYAPMVYVDESSDGDMDEDDDLGDDYSSSDGSDFWDEEVYPSSDSDEEMSALRQARVFHNHYGHIGRAQLRQFAESVSAEQYDVTPIRLRETTKGMKVLEKLEVEVNYQHYKFCRAIWKGNLGLSEPTAPVGKQTAYGKMGESGSKEVAAAVLSEGVDGESHVMKKQRTEGSSAEPSTRVDKKGKGKAVEIDVGPSWTVVDGDKVEHYESPAASSSSSSSQGIGTKRAWEGSDTSSSSQDVAQSRLMGHVKSGSLPKTEIRYWNNSCCGKRCLGWIRIHHN
ncbi:hypothetical protein EDD21DRAFT_364962 [Dissophora ornata]|nr:hypothetical protein EDD21DRAFT_364962 [Dissophora ornata]